MADDEGSQSSIEDSNVSSENTCYFHDGSSPPLGDKASSAVEIQVCADTELEMHRIVQGGNELHHEDPEDPYNWSSSMKMFVAAQICIYTFTVYLGSSIGLASEPIFAIEYEVSYLVASLVLAAYVFGYGVGAMIFSPMSELPSLGRNIPYIISFLLFLGLSVIVATSKTFVSLVIARFFQGFMGSPALATGGASMRDMFAVPYMPLAFACWMGAATLGPALGPTISAYLVQTDDWRRPFWALLFLALPVFFCMFVALPETSRAKILFDRRRRLGLPVSCSTADEDATMSSKITQMLTSTLYRPIRIMVTQPAVAFANFYTCLIYSLYYTFFESFPRIYIEVYGFSIKETGLAFLAIAIGTLLETVLFLPWALWWARRETKRSHASVPEHCLVPALYGCFAIPVGLLIFAWTSRISIHWSVSLFGVVVFTAGVLVNLQCLATYLILVYEEHAASLLAGNDFMRASLAAGAITFAQPLYANLGVDKGVSILAAGTVLCIIGMFFLYMQGAKLRKHWLG